MAPAALQSSSKGRRIQVLSWYRLKIHPQLVKAFASHFWLILRRERILLLFGSLLALIILGGFGFALFEATDPSPLIRFGHGLWWAIVTITTVGYGDIVPQTVTGRLLGFVLMFTGLISLSLLTATIASVFIERKIRKEKGLEAVTDRNHIVLLGWNRGGEQILHHLNYRLPKGTPLVLVSHLTPEQVDSLVNLFPNLLLRFVRGDCQREEILEKANIRQARQVVLLADRSGLGLNREQVDQRTLLVALTVRALNPRVKITAELLQAENRPHLQRAQVDDIVVRGEYDSALLACSTESTGLFRILQTLLAPEGHNFWTVKIPPNFQGRTVWDFSSYLLQEHQALLIGLYSEGYKIRLEDLLSPEPSAIDEFIARKFAEAGKLHLFGRHKLELQINPAADHVLSPQEVAVIISNKPLSSLSP